MTATPFKSPIAPVHPAQNDPPWIGHAYSLKGLIPPLVLILAAWWVLPWDVWISLYCHRIPAGHPKFLRDILDNAEPFGHGVGVAIVSLSVLVLDRRQWKTGFSLLIAGWGAGLLANLGKLIIARVRPRNFEFATLDVSATWEGWLPFLTWSSASQSFPSGHTASAFAMAVMLASLYPRGRWLFFLLAVLVMGHRLHSGAHYPSDILAGAAIGWLFALACLRLAVRYEYLKH